MTMADVITAVTTFLADYSIYIGAAVVVGIAGSLFARFLRSGR